MRLGGAAGSIPAATQEGFTGSGKLVMKFAALLDAIHAAAFVPAEWPRVLESLCERTGSASSTMLVCNGRDPPGWQTTSRTRILLEGLTRTDVWQRRERTATHLLGAGDGAWQFHGVEDLMSARRLAGDPVYQAYREAGLGWQIGTAIPLARGSAMILSFEREVTAGRHDPALLRRLACLRPHLQRAAWMAAESGFRRARSAIDALGALAVPAALLDRGGRIVGANPWMTPRLLATRAGGRVVLGDADADARLAAMLRGRAPACTIAVPARPPLPARVVQLAAVTGAALELFADDLVMLVVSCAQDARWQPKPAWLCALHGLSPAEGRLAAALADGSSLAVAAARCHIRMSTARAYLEAVFRKTGCHRQAELVSLLAHLRPFAAAMDAAGGAGGESGFTGICQ